MFEQISEFAHRFAAFSGERTHFGASRQKVSPQDVQTAFEYGSLSDLLHYETFDAETRIFHNRMSQGFVLEASTLSGASEETANIFASLLLDVLPEGYDMQIMLWGSPHIGNILEAFRKERSSAEIYQWLAQKRVQWLAEGAYRSLTSQGIFLLRHFRLFISVSVPKEKNHPDNTGEMVRLRQKIMSTLQSISMLSAPIDADTLLEIVTDILHPSTRTSPAQTVWNPHHLLSDQITDPEYCTRIYPDNIAIDNGKESFDLRALTVCEYPESVALWKMEEAIGRLYNTALQIPCPFLLSFSIRLQGKEGSTFSTVAKSWDTEKAASAGSILGGKRLSRKLAELRHVQDRLNEGDRLLHTHFTVLMFAKSREADFAERKIRDLYQSIGWKLKKPRYLQLQSLLSVLPMRMSEGAYEDFRAFGRLYTMTAFNAASVAPLLGEWQGTRTPTLILPGRRGQVTTFTPFDNESGNYNVLIAAESGKGKTTFSQEYLVGLMGSGGRVWVIDIGHSYEKTCRLLGGTFIEFAPETEICINPFTHIRHFDEALELLKPLLSAMARSSSRVSDEENAFLERAIKAVWQTHGRQATVTTVAEWLAAEDDPVCKNLALLLGSYTAGGMYGRYFEGASTIDISNSLVVLELQDLNNRKDLRRIVMMVLMFQINQVMYLGERSRQKTLILDEFWQHFGGQSEGMSDFIEAFARTVRRFTGSLVSIAQSINDYFKNATTLSVYENSDYMIVLGQKDESIDQLAKNERFSLNPLSAQLFKSLRKTDEYSECIIKSPSGLSVHRILLDPWSRILYSSKGREFDAVRQWQESGCSLMEAIEKVTETAETGESSSARTGAAS